MMDSEINYNQLVEKALLSVVRESLRYVVQNGLPGQQHFYITFSTRNPDVAIPDHLRDKYKDEMTIVLQHQFWNLTVEEDHFSLELSFNNKREPLIIPFAAVTAFADPSVQFGLQFSLDEDLEDAGEEQAPAMEDSPSDAEEASKGSTDEKAGEVITLDAFRKK